MTLRLTPTPGSDQGTARWDITDDAGAPIGEVHASNRATWDTTSGPVTNETRYVAGIGDLQVTGPTLARTMRAVAAILEHAAGYAVADDPTEPAPAPDTPCLRVFPEERRSTIRLDEATSTPINGIKMTAAPSDPPFNALIHAGRT